LLKLPEKEDAAAADSIYKCERMVRYLDIKYFEEGTIRAMNKLLKINLWHTRKNGLFIESMDGKPNWFSRHGFRHPIKRLFPGRSAWQSGKNERST